MSDQELRLEVQRFSMEALAVAKQLVDGVALDDLRDHAIALQDRLPSVVAPTSELTGPAKAEINRMLSDARLDLSYVLSDGARPSSTRLAHYADDVGSGN